MSPKPRFQVTAGLIRHQGRLLISQRPPGKHLAGFWEFPGGKQEKNETLQECLARELKEELGLDVIVGDPFMTVEHEYETKHITLHGFECTLVKGEPAHLEGQQTRWVKLEELNDYAFAPPDKKMIDRLLS